jgi:hypothetical protein
MEELHMTVIAPVGLPKAEYDAMQRALRSQRFSVRLRNAVREVLGRYPSLRKAQLRITR